MSNGESNASDPLAGKTVLEEAKGASKATRVAWEAAATRVELAKLEAERETWKEALAVWENMTLAVWEEAKKARGVFYSLYSTAKIVKKSSDTKDSKKALIKIVPIVSSATTKAISGEWYKATILLLKVATIVERLLPNVPAAEAQTTRAALMKLYHAVEAANNAVFEVETLEEATRVMAKNNHFPKGHEGGSK